MDRDGPADIQGIWTMEEAEDSRQLGGSVFGGGWGNWDFMFMFVLHSSFSITRITVNGS